ncbi:MAG: hypothetical protein QXK49_01810 [Candidatus Aenigmatarchaeota archaeon]
MQETLKVGEAATVEVIRAFRVDWLSIVLVVFILVLIYLFYKKKGGKMNFKDILLALIIGFIFAFVAYVLTGDNSSIVVGLLVIYFELKFKERRFKK